jgi:hypothetical protein
MKYIKPFNEAKDNWSKIKAGDVLEFANNSHLVYLLDKGYTIDVRRSSGGTHDDNDLLSDSSYIRIINLENTTRSSISKPWNEIKDYFIPFLKRFVNQFGLSQTFSDEIEIEMSLILKPDNLGNLPPLPRTFKLDDVLNDNIKIGNAKGLEYEIKWIKIKR